MWDGFMTVRLFFVSVFIISMTLMSYVFDSVVMPNPDPGENLQTVNSERLQSNLKTHVIELAQKIGFRNTIQYEGLNRARDYIVESFESLGYKVELERYTVVQRRGFDLYGPEKTLPVVEVANVIAQKQGDTDEKLILGAHYDTVIGTLGADDNASGVAALLELARLLKDSQHRATIKFIAYVNEEPPYFQTEEMGSFVSAELSAKRREKVLGMISLECIGFFSDAANSQKYPAPLKYFYPDQGNFVSFVGNRASRTLVKRSIEAFRRANVLPSEGASLPEVIREIGFSDQWSYWIRGYKALMVTDTAHLRNPNYHTMQDTADSLDYDRMSRVVEGMLQVSHELAELRSDGSSL